MTTHLKIQQLLQSNYLVFKALGDQQRQKVLFHLFSNDNLSVGELANQMALSRPTVSHHIKVLKKAGLLSEVKQGRKRFYRPQFSENIQSLKQLVEQIDQIEPSITKGGSTS